jgi:hypothetical protein
VRTEGKVPVTSEYDNASVHDQGNDSALAECSAVLGKNATCFGGILWDAKDPILNSPQKAVSRMKTSPHKRLTSTPLFTQ